MGAKGTCIYFLEGYTHQPFLQLSGNAFVLRHTHPYWEWVCKCPYQLMDLSKACPAGECFSFAFLWSLVRIRVFCLLSYFFSSSLTGDCLDPSQLMLMFPYWFMTAFSIIRIDWQVGSVCPDLPILLMAFDTYSALMDVWSIASLFPIWCPHRHRQRNVAHCPSSWDQPQARCSLSGSQFPRLDMEDNERAFTRERRDTAGSLWGTPTVAFWYSSQAVPELSFCKLRSRYSLGAPKDGTETLREVGPRFLTWEEGKDEQIAKM